MYDARIDVLESDVLLQRILSFLPNTYRFTATVNKHFHKSYHLAFPGNCTTTYENAVANRATSQIWWNEESNEINRNRLCEYAALYGRLDVLKYYHWSKRQQRRQPWRLTRTVVCAQAAARGGHLFVLQWLHRNGYCHGDILIGREAAWGGHLDVLKWSKENSLLFWDIAICYNAAWSGHLDVLKWARQNECPWNDLTCYFATLGGHLDVLKWARENGCQWDAEACLQVASNDTIASWIRANVS